MALSTIWGELTYADGPLKKTAKVAAQTIEGKRAKLIENLNEQRRLIEADIKGETYIPRKPNGEPKGRVARWWWDYGHQVAFILRFGLNQLPIPGIGLNPMLFKDRKEIPEAIEQIIEAIRSGDLDEALKNAKTPKGKTLAEIAAEAAPVRKAGRKAA